MSDTFIKIKAGMFTNNYQLQAFHLNARHTCFNEDFQGFS